MAFRVLYKTLQEQASRSRPFSVFEEKLFLYFPKYFPDIPAILQFLLDFLPRIPKGQIVFCPNLKGEGSGDFDLDRVSFDFDHLADDLHLDMENLCSWGIGVFTHIGILVEDCS